MVGVYFYFILVVVRCYDSCYFFVNSIFVGFYVNVYQFIVVNFGVVFVDFVSCVFVIYKMFGICGYFVVV